MLGIPQPRRSAVGKGDCIHFAASHHRLAGSQLPLQGWECRQSAASCGDIPNLGPCACWALTPPLPPPSWAQCMRSFFRDARGISGGGAPHPKPPCLSISFLETVTSSLVGDRRAMQCQRYSTLTAARASAARPRKVWPDAPPRMQGWRQTPKRCFQSCWKFARKADES